VNTVIILAKIWVKLMQSFWTTIKAHGRSGLLVNYHKWKIEKAKEKLSKLPPEKAAIELDFKSLDVVPKLNEQTLYLNPKDEGLSAQLYAWRLREPINTHFLCDFIAHEEQNMDVVIDIGGNIGYFPLVEIVSGAPQVIAIEPVPETYTFLKKNMEHFENIKTLNVAVSDKKETVKMYIPSQRNLATIFGDTDYLKMAKATINETVDVQALPLEDILKNEKLNGKRALIRMDIEGFEKNVTKKLPEEIYALSFELHTPILGYDSTIALIKNLRKTGYKIRLIIRELDGLGPIIKLLGVKKALRFYESLIETRVFHEPSMNLIKEIIKKQKENPHILAVKN
jgi:FkbM family methyltransferase